MFSPDAARAFTWAITILSLCGTALNVRKSVWCFYLWSVSNVAWFAYDVWTGCYSRAMLDAVHFAFAIWGIAEWRRKP
jgi:nicotinamide riboside transporter PnuC